ncbi:permease prefix domain 1-containing protein [Bailinhaonella thermotolerans]|uniref:permease prefix domain 1-containing protein n=1 Tax=Bailinhaonella thermotolerans TaxID=1070861 RepID=UPI00192A5CA8|nr:permease prefix domain 1-containing protein [Bailinhaonella thermotolerans]
MGGDAVGGFVRELDEVLYGPRRVRRDFVAEVRDGLEDAAEALVAEGMPEAEARRQAVAEFGGVGEVAAGFQAELTAAQGRWTALVQFFALVGSVLMWWGVWRVFPGGGGAGWDDGAEWAHPLARALDYLQAGVALASVAAAYAFRRGGPARTRVVTRAVGILAIVQVPVIYLLSAALSAGVAPAPSTPATIASGVSAALSAWAVLSGVRCVRAARKAAAYA